MFDLLGYQFATMPPAAFFVLLLVAALAGYCVGLFGYAQASSHAYRRLIAAQQRVGGPR